MAQAPRVRLELLVHAGSGGWQDSDTLRLLVQPGDTLDVGSLGRGTWGNGAARFAPGTLSHRGWPETAGPDGAMPPGPWSRVRFAASRARAWQGARNHVCVLTKS